MSNINLEFPDTLTHFLQSNKRVRAIRGPVGSGKSVACAAELLLRAARQTPDADGIRRTRMVIVRNTLQQLKTTCLPTVETILRPIMNFKVSDSTIQIRAGDIHSDWILLPLDTPQNIQRLLSLELTMAWASEFRELNPEVLNAVLSRCGRYPSRMNNGQGPTFYGLIQETNSFSEDSPWYDVLEAEGALPSTWDYFIQPGGMDEDAENRDNLPPTYYEDLLESNPPEWSDQYIHNLITPSLSGQAVFRNSFDHDYHVAEHELIPSRGHPLIIGLDTGRNPAAVICQVNHTGRMFVMQECYAENMGMERFLEEHLRPALFEERFAGLPSYIVIDPAGLQKSQIGEESVVSMIQGEGFECKTAQTNNIDPRLRAVDKWLGRSMGREPAMLFDSVGCPQLITAIRSTYRYKIKKDGELDAKPEKKHPISDLADALQYACLGTAQNILGRVMRRNNSVDEAQPKFSEAAWT